ncbi:MAG: hypothetical protein WBO00_12035 [Steroidobacteraceae bacterium]
MKILKAMTAGMVLAALPLASHAEDMSYSNIDLAYVSTDVDGFGPSFDGFGVRGSIGFAENYFAFAEYSSVSASGFDVDQTAVGLGGHYGLTDNLDLVGRAGWYKAEVGSGGASLDDDGYLVSAGLRGRAGDKVELEGSVIYTDVGGSGGDQTTIAVGGRYYFTPTFALGAEYQDNDDWSSYLVGVRFSF